MLLRSAVRVTLANPPVNLVRNYNANRCAITRIKQEEYTRVYPTVLVYPDGSTITIRYPEPRAIVKLPVLYDELTTDVEKAAYMARRRPREEIRIKEDSTNVKFDGSKYLKFVKNKK